MLGSGSSSAQVSRARWQVRPEGGSICSVCTKPEQMRVQLLMQKWFYFRLLTEPVAVAGEGPTAMTEWSVGDISGVWCLVWTQLHSSMAVLKLNPKGWFFPALFISLLPQNKHGLVAARRCNTQKHDSINNFRGCKYGIELNVSFLSLEDEVIE